MIIPSKHINFSESILGLGGTILDLILEPINIDDLWVKYSKRNNTQKFPSHHSFSNFLLAVDFLFLLGAIDINDNQKIYLCV